MTTLSRATLRIAHLADTHLGYSGYGKSDPETGRNQRAVDFERAFAHVIDDILARDVDLVIHAGDVFHHTRPSWHTLALFVQQMRRLELAGIPSVVIAGNHDTPRLRTSGSLYSVMELSLPRVRFITGYMSEEQPYPEFDLVVHGVPHGSLVNPDPPLILPESGKRNVVVTHGVAAGAKMAGSREQEETELRGNVFDTEIDYVAMGHIHLRQIVGLNKAYSGSTERTSWGDQGATPGYALVTLGSPGDLAQVEFIDTPARPMETLAAIDGADRTARDLADMILDRAGALGMPDAMVRVELRSTPRPLFRETDAIVRRETGDNAWLIRLTLPGEALDPLGREGPSTMADLNPLTLFCTFVEERRVAGDYEPAFAEAFGARGKLALERAIARVEDASANEAAG
ncbi:MAG: DNA repair exonuclease [Thermomicrobiales bacterium]|nr:DNA repair exonuclease [Thermomicrobiales bacterium]